MIYADLARFLRILTVPPLSAGPSTRATGCTSTLAEISPFATLRPCKEGARTGGTGKLLYLHILEAYRLVSEYAKHLASSSHIAFKGRASRLFFA